MNNSNPFDNKNFETYTIRTWGESIRERREQLNITARQLAKSINMSTVYLSELERCNRPAPSGFISGIDYMSRIAEALELDSSQKETFNLMASVSRLNMMNLVATYCTKNLSSLRFLLKAVETNLSNEEWEKLYQSIFETHDE